MPILPPWDELDHEIRGWFKGLILGTLLGIVFGWTTASAVFLLSLFYD